MYKFISNHVVNFLVLSYLWVIFILPFQWYKFGILGEIFPAFDIVIIYHLSTYKSLKYWQLFIIGIFTDQLHALPLGISSLALIVGNIGLNYLSRWFLLREYFTNLIVFCGYSTFVILARYLAVAIKSHHHIEGYSIFFYLLTTILSYPIMSALLEKPIKMLGQNA